MPWNVVHRRDPAQRTLHNLRTYGRDATIEGDRKDGIEILKLWMVTDNHLDAAKLKPLLAEHLKAFRKAFKASEKEAG